METTTTDVCPPEDSQGRIPRSRHGNTLSPPRPRPHRKKCSASSDKPLIQYGVEEAVAAGCTEIIIVTGRGKTTMEDHFDRSPELEASLEAKNKIALLEIARSVSKLAKITYTRQAEPLGLGHAVLMAKEIVGNEPFCVLLPDDIVDAEPGCMKQMVDAFPRSPVQHPWLRGR